MKQHKKVTIFSGRKENDFFTRKELRKGEKSKIWGFEEEFRAIWEMEFLVGFPSVTDWFTRGIAAVHIGIGGYVLLRSGYEEYRNL